MGSEAKKDRVLDLVDQCWELDQAARDALLARECADDALRSEVLACLSYGTFAAAVSDRSSVLRETNSSSSAARRSFLSL